jgi:hypothetical protein
MLPTNRWAYIVLQDNTGIAPRTTHDPSGLLVLVNEIRLAGVLLVLLPALQWLELGVFDTDLSLLF